MSTRQLLATGEKTAVRHDTSKAKYRASGFTLIEVMIALAIFVIGALAIVRIFPPALNVIQGSESRSIAMNRARAFLARSTSQPGLVPDSTFDFTKDGSMNIVWNNYNGSVTGTTTRNNSLPTGIDEATIQSSALGHFKRVVGEKHRVLQFGPATSPTRFVLSQFAHDAENNTNDVSIWVEDRVNGVRVENDGDLDFTDAKLSIDGRDFNERDYKYPNGSTPTRVAVADNEKLAPDEWTGVNTIYYVSYRYGVDANNDDVIDSGERMRGVSDEPLILPKTAGGGPVDAVARVLAGRAPLAFTIIPGEISVRVKRKIRNAVIDPTATDQAAERDSIRGYVQFANNSNAIPSDLQPAGPANGFIYSTVSLDYTVRDWRWLIDDDTPQANTNTIQTQIRFYDNERLAASSLNLVSENTTKPVIGLLLGIDSSGNSVPTFGWWDQQTEQADTALTNVNRKTGEIVYNLSTLSSTDAPRARTAYWTLDGWAQQISVAARSYVPFYTLPATTRPANEREPWREYYWDGPGSSSLYFPPSEAGKTVLVTFEYEESTNNYKTRTSVLTIEDKVDGTVPTGASAAFGNAARRAEFSNPATNGVYDVRAILSVQGLSVQSRTAWIENNARYTQAEAIGYRKLD
ncbi:MAG TPA: prepilin-type N-terminal cleavage/methylation domain-containing protein [Abditibacteriaceae bacterium]|jgi:prepilin-type N-terminal cleavage/methylation domain-containing protein